MTAQHFRALLFKRWYFIVLCMLLAGLGAGVGSRFLPRMYAGTVKLQLGIPPLNSTLLLEPENTLQTDVQLATSTPVLDAVVAHFPGLSVDALRSEVSATAIPNTAMFQVTVLDRSAARAAALANALADALVAAQAQAQKDSNQKSEQDVRDSITATQNQIDSAMLALHHLLANPQADPAEIQQLETHISNLQYQYTQLEGTLSRIQVAEAQYTSSLRVAEAAKPSSNPVGQPIYVYIGAGLLLGLLLGVVWLVAHDRFDQRLRSARRLEKVLGWPVLAEVASAEAEGQSAVSAPLSSETSAAYETLGRNLAFLGIDAHLCSLAMVSATPDGDESVVASNLALFLATAGQKTLLVDANFARPSQQERFGLTSDIGLSDAILAESYFKEDDLSPDQFMHHSPLVNLPLLEVMPTGPLPPNASGLLKSKALHAFLQALLAPRNQMVILDVPSPLEVEGAAALAEQVDGVVLVVDLAQARREALLKMKARLSEMGIQVLGCVVSSKNAAKAKLPVPQVAVPAEQ